ncbi:hypothetical protein OHR68_00905 [Spirillospora sp. NBC_00431]
MIVRLSPFILDAAYSGTRMDWVVLSDIGQTYGAISVAFRVRAAMSI